MVLFRDSIRIDRGEQIAQEAVRKRGPVTSAARKALGKQHRLSSAVDCPLIFSRLPVSGFRS
jgi:hypothetical protein